MNHKHIFITGIQYGALLGLGLCLYTVLMWLMELDTTYLSVGQYFDVAIILLPLIAIILGIKNFHSKGNKLTFWNRIYLALIIGVISSLIYEPFLYLYHEAINPDWFDSVLKLKREELQSSGKGEEEINTVLAQLSTQNKARAGIFSAFIPSAILIPFIAGLLSLIFIKNKKNV